MEHCIKTAMVERKVIVDLHSGAAPNNNFLSGREGLFGSHNESVFGVVQVTSGDLAALSRSMAPAPTLSSLPPPPTPQPRNPMLMSMDKLFAQGEVVDTRTSITEDPRIVASPRSSLVLQQPPQQQQQGPPQVSRPADARHFSDQVSSSGMGGNPTPPRTSSPSHNFTERSSTPRGQGHVSGGSVRDSSSELYKEYQQQKQRLREQLILQVRAS